MPQDELWGASARLTGYNLNYYFSGPSNEHDLFSVRTLWSKQPAETTRGNCTLEVPDYVRGHFPDVMSAVHYELTGGLARNVPGVVRSRLRAFREDFAQGSLH